MEYAVVLNVIQAVIKMLAVRLQIMRACVQKLLQHTCLKTTCFMVYKHLSKYKNCFKNYLFKNI